MDWLHRGYWEFGRWAGIAISNPRNVSYWEDRYRSSGIPNRVNPIDGASYGLDTPPLLEVWPLGGVPMD